MRNQLWEIGHDYVLEDDIILLFKDELKQVIECPRVIVFQAFLEERLIIKIQLKIVHSIAIE